MYGPAHAGSRSLPLSVDKVSDGAFGADCWALQGAQATEGAGVCVQGLEARG